MGFIQPWSASASKEVSFCAGGSNPAWGCLVAEPDKVLVGELNVWVANLLGPSQTIAHIFSDENMGLCLYMLSLRTLIMFLRSLLSQT